MEKMILGALRLDSSCEEWRNNRSKWEDYVSDKTVPALQHSQLLQKINTFYSESSADRQEHADAVLSVSYHALLSDSSDAGHWSSLEDKHKISTAKVLSHLTVKLLKANRQRLCMNLSELLLNLVSDKCLDESHKDCLSIAGYVYKSLWNTFSTASSKYSVDAEYKGRIMALQLAVSASFDQQIHKLSQQLIVTLSSITPHEEKHRAELLRGLAGLRQCVQVAMRRSPDSSDLWKYLSLYICCMESLYNRSEHDKICTDFEVPIGLEKHGSVCKYLLECYSLVTACKAVPNSNISNDILELLPTCDNQLHTQSLTSLLTRLVKLITTNQQQVSAAVKLSWKPLLAADIFVSRHQFELSTEHTDKTRSLFVRRQFQSISHMVRYSKQLLSECGVHAAGLSATLDMDTQVITTGRLTDPSSISSHVSELVNEVGRMIQSLSSTPGEKPVEVTQSVTEMTKAVLSLIDVTRVDEIVLLQRQLCDYLARQSLFSEALDVFTSLSKLPNTHWQTLLIDWIKIKKRARLASDDSITSRTMAMDVFSKQANPDELIDLIFKEYTEFSIRDTYYAELDALLSAMRLHAVSSTHMGLYYLCQTELHLTLNKDISLAEKCVTKGLAELKKNISVYCNDMRAQLYTWQYVIQYRKYCDMSGLTTALTEIDYQPPACTYKCESKLHEPLSQAIQQWGECNSSIYSQQKTAQCISIVSHSYFLSRRLNKVIEVCELAERLIPDVMKRKDDSTVSSLKLLHIDTLIYMGDVSSAQRRLTDMDYTDPIDTHLDILKAQLYIKTNKVQRGLEILEELQSTQTRQTLDSAYLSLSAHCIILETMMSCSNIQTKRSLSHHALHCQRDHASLFTSISTHPVKNYSLKLKYLNAVLHSYITLGKVNIFIGSVREASCFLLAARNMSQILSLSLRAADVTTSLAQLDCFVADFAGAEANLRHTSTTLTSELSLSTVHQQLPITPVSKSNKLDLSQTSNKPTRKDLNKVKQSHLFGFESDESGGEEESFSIKQPNAGADSDENGDDEYKLPTYGTDVSRDVTASPSFSRHKADPTTVYQSWAPYTHPVTCTCTQCQDHMLHLTHLDMIVTQCQLLCKSGQTSDALKLSQVCRRFYDVIETRRNCDSRETLNALTVRRKLQLSVVIMRCYLNTKNYTGIHQEWEKSVEAYTTQQHQSMIVCQLRFIKCLPHIMHYFKIVPSELDNLDSKLDCLRITGDVQSSPLQPIRTQENSYRPAPPSHVIKAPHKTRRLAASKMSKLAFDDSDNEENITNSVTKKKNKSLQRAVSPLVIGLNKIKSAGSRSTKKSSCSSVFCDDGSENTPASKLQPKRSARNSKKKLADISSGDEAAVPVRTRKTRTANRELLRSVVIHEDEQLPMLHSDRPMLKSDEPRYEDISILQSQSGDKTSSSVASDDDMEIMRGDTDNNPRSRRARKCSDAESMRSSVPMRSISPPELLTSPTKEDISTSGDELDIQAVDTDDAIANLTNIWKSISSSTIPYQLYRDVSQVLAVLHYNQSDMWMSAFYFAETQAINFSHKTRHVHAQKLHAQKKDDKTGRHNKPCLEIPGSKTLHDFKSAVNSLPADWVVCNMSVVTEPGSQEQQLYVTRLCRDMEPVVMLAKQMYHPQRIWSEFEDILKCSKDSMGETERSIWWEKRRDTDDRLKRLLDGMSGELGVSRSALLGHYTDKKSRQHVDKYTTKVIKELKVLGVDSVSTSLIAMLVSGASSLSEDELSRYIHNVYPQLDTQSVSKLTSLVTDASAVNMDTRAPVILCLDKYAHSVCWESMPYLAENAISRMPSVYTVQSYLRCYQSQSTVYDTGIDSDKTYYILNPADNLPSTESLFKPIFSSKKSWRGIASKKPTVEEFKQGLISHDLFIFLGHGNGAKFLKGRDLCQIDCEAAVLLMGCSSGAFDSRGDMEPTGIIYDYHIAKCPSVLACLWDVTDKDIDRFTKCILKYWLSGDNEKKKLSDNIAIARRACKLQYLVGSASVVYGLPVSIR